MLPFGKGDMRFVGQRKIGGSGIGSKATQLSFTTVFWHPILVGLSKLSLILACVGFCFLLL